MKDKYRKRRILFTIIVTVVFQIPFFISPSWRNLGFGFLGADTIIAIMLVIIWTDFQNKRRITKYFEGE